MARFRPESVTGIPVAGPTSPASPSLPSSTRPTFHQGSAREVSRFLVARKMCRLRPESGIRNAVSRTGDWTSGCCTRAPRAALAQSTTPLLRASDRSQSKERLPRNCCCMHKCCNCLQKYAIQRSTHSEYFQSRHLALLRIHISSTDLTSSPIMSTISISKFAQGLGGGQGTFSGAP